MKILVFEYITGGGFNKQDLPEMLAGEGRLMLNGLLDCFSEIKGVELSVMLDWRVSKSINTVGMDAFIIGPEHNVMDEFGRLVRQADAVWPIAPEFDSILQNLCEKVELLNRPLLTSPARAVAMTGDKYKAFKRLIKNNIATVDTQLFEDCRFASGEWMVKRIDGAGCGDSYLLTNQRDFSALSRQLAGKGPYIIQPHLQGEKTSMSCLFKQGRGWLLCINLQGFKLIAKQYQLMEIVVNHSNDFKRYEGLVNDIAKAFPDLWGYVGIDLIETADEIKVLEINPRLTTSFVGIQAACGINTCRCVLDLLDGNPAVNFQYDRPITLKIKQDSHAN